MAWRKYIPVILPVACTLAVLLGLSIRLALTDRRSTAVKSFPDRFVLHPHQLAKRLEFDSPYPGT
ncbi:hypothetical protein CIG58_10885 [Klebsiella oxytoca]|nr:hypothetical protein CIG58_10885 [Klebsiella oxytoca]